MTDQSVQLSVFAPALSADPRQAARTARQLGFGGLQFDAEPTDLDLTALSASGRREFRHLISSNDQQLVGLRLDLGTKGFAPGSDVDRQLSRLERAMEAAAGLSAPFLCVDVGPLPAATREPKPIRRITQQQAGLILLPETAAATAPEPDPAAAPVDPGFADDVNSAMAELGRRADRYSVVLAFRSELSSLASLSRVLRQADCPWFGIDLDPVAVLRDEWDLDECFSRLGPLIRHVRGRDAMVGAERRTKAAPLGQGSVSWPSILANLDEAGYRGWITIDPVDLTDRGAAAVAGLSHIRSLLH